MIKNNISEDLLHAVMARKVIHSCLNLVSLYGNMLIHNRTHCTFAEKLTVNKLLKFVDLTLNNINRFALKKKGYESVIKHKESIETSTDLIIEAITLTELLVDDNAARKRVLQRLENAIMEENKRFYNKNK